MRQLADDDALLSSSFLLQFRYPSFDADWPRPKLGEGKRKRKKERGRKKPLASPAEHF